MQADNQDLLDFMNEYWLPNSGTAESFWEHEWSKHGTCINTLSPGCYGDGYVAGQEVVDFFARTVDLFKVCYFLTHLLIPPSLSSSPPQKQNLTQPRP